MWCWAEWVLYPVGHGQQLKVLKVCEHSLHVCKTLPYEHQASEIVSDVYVNSESVKGILNKDVAVIFSSYVFLEIYKGSYKG